MLTVKILQFNFIGGRNVKDKKTILIADDKPEFARVLTEYIEEDEELEVIGVARLYSNYDETWYLAKYKGQMGFVKAQYTRSLRDVLKATYPETTEVKIKKIGSLKYDTSVRDYYGNVLKTFNQYEAVKILEDKGNDYLVEIDSTVGLVSKDSVKTYKVKRK